MHILSLEHFPGTFKLRAVFIEREDLLKRKKEQEGDKVFIEGAEGESFRTTLVALDQGTLLSTCSRRASSRYC